jgi:hypothetical protein
METGNQHQKGTKRNAAYALRSTNLKKKIGAVIIKYSSITRGSAPRLVSIADSKIINLETLATDNHYPGALPSGWVGLFCCAYHTPAKHAPNMPRPRLRTWFSFWYFPSCQKRGRGGVGARNNAPGETR